MQCDQIRSDQSNQVWSDTSWSDQIQSNQSNQVRSQSCQWWPELLNLSDSITVWSGSLRGCELHQLACEDISKSSEGYWINYHTGKSRGETRTRKFLVPSDLAHVGAYCKKDSHPARSISTSQIRVSNSIFIFFLLFVFSFCCFSVCFSVCQCWERSRTSVNSSRSQP